MNEMLDNLLTALETAMAGRSITRFFKGKMDVPAKSDMPICCVYPLATSTRRSGTVRDAVEWRAAVEIVTEVHVSAAADEGQGDKLYTVEWLTDVIEERESDGTPKADTVIGTLNDNLTLSGRSLYIDDISVRYDPYLRDGGSSTARATVEFTAHARPNRT